MDEVLADLLLLNFESFVELQDTARLQLQAEILAARLAIQHDLELFCSAERCRQDIGEMYNRRYDNLSRNIELLRMYVHISDADPVARKLIGDLLRRAARQSKSDSKSKAPQESPKPRPEGKPEEDFMAKIVFRFGCPDGFVTYGRGGSACETLERYMNVQFGRGGYSVRSFDSSKPDPLDLPELRAIFGQSDGWFSVPDKIETPPKRWKCIYRLRGPDGFVRFADGCVAFDRLFSMMRTKFRFKDIELSVQRVDQLSAETANELKTMHGTTDGGYCKRRSKTGAEGGGPIGGPKT